ncbi:MAG TPA: response regulator [Candidatus Eisenbacteria bacterium]|jgi:signal transduction histidine kinase
MTETQGRIRILHLEDDPNDAELVLAALEDDLLQVTIEHVTGQEEFTAAVERGEIDLILSDYSLPGFDGVAALHLAREKMPDVPFIIVSGQLGEEAAVESVRGGATDYVLKQRLSRLGPSVRRALSEADERRKRREAEDALRRSEAQLRHAQKMEAVGRLAAGVAHDFNNLLTVIIGYSQLQQRRFAPEDPAAQDAEEVLGAAERAASLTRQLLIFSRQQVPQPRVLDLNGIVSDMHRMLHRLIGEDIELLAVLAPDLGRVHADAGEIEQVLMNLVVNAKDAMPAGGKLKIETCNAELDDNYLRDHPLTRPGRYVVLAVSDSGCGMGAETQASMFEPFFTTKEMGKGTGLGLSTVHGIVQQSGGHVDVHSEVGVGSVFKIYLPRVDADVDKAVVRDSKRPAPGIETLLLVEDEAQVRRVVSEMLRLNGYTVLEASGPDEGLSRARDHTARLDLIVSDVVMPGMNGRELASKVARLHPEAKILFISGYSDNAIVQRGVLGVGAAFLQKPFTVEVLLRKIRELLDGDVREAA